MIKIIKITDPDCYRCIGASYRPRDCSECEQKIIELPICMECVHRNENVMRSEKLLCTKLHAWVEPCDYCAWGSKELEDE